MTFAHCVLLVLLTPLLLLVGALLVAGLWMIVALLCAVIGYLIERITRGNR